MLRTFEAPDDWGEDPLSEFIDLAARNTIASFAKHRREFNRLRDIHLLYSELIQHLDNSPDWFAGFFLMRAQASYLAATRLAVSTQVGDVYPVLRACVESSLYGLHVHRHPESREIWLRRGEGKKARDAVSSEFSYGNVRRNLEAVDPDTAWIAATLYERAISFGGHPNPEGIQMTLNRTVLEDADRFDQSYLTSDSVTILFALLTTAQVGICSLRIFRNVFRERFDILQLSDRLTALAKGVIAPSSG